ncbi:phosphatidylserine decarboxylase [Thiospirillum jenense]|uniref:Phosphatidylserine decarboxylase proenzyme n=1 Tax=Thiospirillum jenense TaxID=1653858 RepID=A0A839HE41_9GAMM|nr:archaetidylserine decarboxylase [Thiospirillum jenense]MBB1127205.1 phosphatidylserine decarboxylase [Thiospirillum jenense]
MWHFTHARLGFILPSFIRLFVKQFAVNLDEAAESSPAAYSTFNAFFTRALRSDARPITDDPQTIISPVDAVISQLGTIENGQLIQAKGRQFTLTELLGGAPDLAQLFDGGLFATLYLSPRDYHRIHTPAAGQLRSMLYIPGRLFSVNPATVRGVPNLFARNERVICVFNNEYGPFVLVLVGAIFVGSIETTWAGEITPPRGVIIRRDDYPNNETPTFARGAECARFNMGSTVIVLLPPGRAQWLANKQPNDRIQCDAALGQWQSRVG